MTAIDLSLSDLLEKETKKPDVKRCLTNLLEEIRSQKFFKEILKEKIMKYLETEYEFYIEKDFQKLKEFIPSWERFRRIISAYYKTHKP